MNLISNTSRLRNGLASVLLTLVLLGSLFALNANATVAHAAEPSNSRMTASSKGITLKKQDGTWVAIRNKKVDRAYTGIAKNKNGWWKVTNGLVDFGYTGVAQNENGWYRVVNGKVDFDYSGIAKNELGWWRIENGKVNFSAQSIYKNEFGWWKTTNGRVTFDENGIFQNNHGLWKCTNSKVTFKDNGLYPDGNELVLLHDSQVDTAYNGFYDNGEGTWLLRKGRADLGYYGIATDENGSYMITNGQLDTTVNRTLTVNGTAYEFQEGKGDLIGVNFIQPDSPWSDVTYDKKKLSTSGCGILAITNAVYNLTGEFLDPLDVANWAYKSKYFNADSNGGIKNRDVFVKVANQFGTAGKFRYAGYGKDVSDASLRNHLKQGNTAILHVNYHFLAVIGYDEVTDKYLILDSYPGSGTSMPSKYRETTRYGDWVSLDTLQNNKWLKVTEYWLYANA